MKNILKILAYAISGTVYAALIAYSFSTGDRHQILLVVLFGIGLGSLLGLVFP